MPLPKKEAQQTAIEVAAAGCEAVEFLKCYNASKDEQRAIDEALVASFGKQACCYAEGGIFYTASQFKDFFGHSWMAKWMASPVAKKVAEDGKAYSASQFHEFFRFKGDWLSKWNAATWATQRHIAEDGKVYTVDEFAEHYKSEWQQKWAKAPVVLCRGCHA